MTPGEERINSSVETLTETVRDVLGACDVLRDMRAEELFSFSAKLDAMADDIKLIKKDQNVHAINIKKFNEILVGAKSIMWLGKIIVAIGAVIGGVWQFFFKHNS